MDHAALLTDIKAVKFNEIRSNTPEYFEGVIHRDTLGQLTGCLEKYFGSALKPADQAPSSEAKKAAEPYGGIWKGQTLYYCRSGQTADCAMLWPWGDGILITLKLILGPM